MNHENKNSSEIVRGTIISTWHEWRMYITSAKIQEQRSHFLEDIVYFVILWPLERHQFLPKKFNISRTILQK